MAGTATSSLWFEQAMAHEAGSAEPEAELPPSTDVAVVGGGFTGLWTALAIKRRRPGAEVLLHCKYVGAVERPHIQRALKQDHLSRAGIE